MKVATKGESQLSYLLPGVQTAIAQLRAAAKAAGITTVVANYGGARTESIVAQLITWRDEAVARGEPFYRVSPFDKGKHSVGGAADLKVTAHPATMTTDQAYAWLGAHCGEYGLVWGGTFRPHPDVFHFESHQTRTQLAARWADWVNDPSFPAAPSSGAVAFGAANWHIAVCAIVLAVAIYAFTRTKH